MMVDELTAAVSCGHGLIIDEHNAVTSRSERPPQNSAHEFRWWTNDAVGEFLQAITEETGYEFDLDSPHLPGTGREARPIALSAHLRDTANPHPCSRPCTRPTSYPSTAESVVDCRILAGCQAAFER